MYPVIRDAAVPGFDTVVNSAFYHVFQDDEGLQAGFAQTLHGATEPGARLFMFEIRNATTSTAFNGKACRPNAIVGGRRAQMRDGPQRRRRPRSIGSPQSASRAEPWANAIVPSAV
jgi:hypothetical protein